MSPIVLILENYGYLKPNRVAMQLLLHYQVPIMERNGAHETQNLCKGLISSCLVIGVAKY